MIEKLINPEHFCEEPEYSALTQEIVEIRRTLAAQLDTAGKDLLEQLSDTYLKQQEVLRNSAFTDGFCAAMELALEILCHKSGFTEDP